MNRVKEEQIRNWIYGFHFDVTGQSEPKWSRMAIPKRLDVTIVRTTEKDELLLAVE